MNFFMAFLFAGTLCASAQIILDNTKLTPGHITSLYTIGGAFLSFLGCYDCLINKFGAGIFSNMLCKSSGVITGAIVSAFLVSIIFKPKN